MPHTIQVDIRSYKHSFERKIQSKGDDMDAEKKSGLQCTEEGCTGEVDLNNEATVMTGCRSSSRVFPCKKCGRLYFLEGDEAHKSLFGVFSRGNQKAFLIEGEVVRK
jgi:hypothetical protein